MREIRLEDVRVDPRSPRSAETQKLAYTQGSDIYVGPGQEEHLPHDLSHVVRQVQGKV